MPATLNPYTYGVNNPILHSDPSGEIAPIIAAILISGVVTGGIEMISQLVQYSGNFHCLNWAQIGMAAGAGVVGGLFGFYGAALGVSMGGAGFLGAMIAGGFGGAAAGIGMRTTQTAISGDWSHWQGDIFNPGQITTDLAFGAVGGAVGYGVQQVFGNITNNIQSNPDFYVTPNGEAIPATKQGIINNLRYMNLKNGKYVGDDSFGPIRVRLDLFGHPKSIGFDGIPDTTHEIPHMHIERRIKINSGRWIDSIKLLWDFFN